MVSLNSFDGDEALVGQRLVEVVLPLRLGEVGLGLVQVAHVGAAGLLQRQFLAAHVVQLLLDLGLAGERRELQIGVGQDRQQLALGDAGAVLDRHLLDPAALDRVEIDGDERRDPGTQGQEVLEDAVLDRRDAEAVAVDRLRPGARREQPEEEDQQQGRAGAAADQDALVDASS